MRSKFYTGITIITIVVFVLFGVVFKLRPELIFPIWYLVPAFFVFLTAASHRILEKALQGRPGLFISYYMGIVGAKLFMSLGFMVVYVLIYRKSAVPFLISTMILYF